MKGKIIVVGIMLLIVASCTKTPQELIVGKWESNEGTLEFFQDGSVILRSPKKGIDNLSGSWIILDDGRLKSTYTYQGLTIAGTDALDFTDKDNLVLVDEEGRTDHMTRIVSSR